MHTKDYQKKYREALTNSFNNKKTKENDLARLKTIQTKINVKNIYPNIFIQDRGTLPTIAKLPKKANIVKSNLEIIQTKINKIYNIYQENYCDDVKPSGFGDFIRGCYFLLQFCNTYNFNYQIIINHPIALFLEKFCKNFTTNKKINKPLFDKIKMCDLNNWRETILDSSNCMIQYVTEQSHLEQFIHYLTTQLNTSEVFTYNIMFPYHVIREEHKKYMRNLLEPNNEIKLFIDETFNILGFFKKSYSVIHIRAGDNYLNESNKTFTSAYLQKLVENISNVIKTNPHINFLLIADNNEIKTRILQEFPILKALFKKITHLGEGTILEREKVKNTMLDFYLMAYSNNIYSFTCYKHGSGFSYWAAITYNVPNKCVFIPN
jgi:hypothetical protein